MKRPFWLLLAAVLLLAACQSPAPATPQVVEKIVTQVVEVQVTKEVVIAPTEAPAPAAAKPTEAPFPTQVLPQAAPPTPPLATTHPELRPPQSGGVLNPPTSVPTVVGNSSVTSRQTQPQPEWATFYDSKVGLTFQYPNSWSLSNSRNVGGVILRVALGDSTPQTNTASITIEVRTKQGDLLSWLSKTLPTGRLLIDAKGLEGGTRSYKKFNAQLAGIPAVFVYAPAHGKVADVAEFHAADPRYFYQFTYLGDSTNSLAKRAAFLHLLSTVTFSSTTSSGIALPSTAFANGIDLDKIGASDFNVK